MKPYILILSILLFSCSDDLNKNEINTKEFTGIWVPFEIQYKDGTTQIGPFSFSNIFGVYAESIKFTSDRKYYPVAWTSESEFIIKTDEIGNFEFKEANNKLFLSPGSWEMEFTVKRISLDEMWLSDDFSTLKLKRELTTY